MHAGTRQSQLKNQVNFTGRIETLHASSSKKDRLETKGSAKKRMPTKNSSNRDSTESQDQKGEISLPSIIKRSSTVTQKKLKSIMAVKEDQISEEPADKEETPIRKRRIKDYDFTSYCLSRNLIKPASELPEIQSETKIVQLTEPNAK